MAYYQVLFHGSGFHVEEEDGAIIEGFYTGRRIVAPDAASAFELAKSKLQGEAKTQQLIAQSIAAGCTPQIEMEEVFRISFWRYWTSRCPTGFIFYENDAEGASEPNA